MGRPLPKFYVYEIWDPVEKKCRYVGKGHGKRAEDQVDPDKINNARLKTLIETRAKEGIKLKPRIVYRHNSEAEVLRKEMALIAKYGRLGIEPGGTLYNLSGGGQGSTGHGKLTIVAGIPYSTIKEAAEAYDVSESVVGQRLSKGWTPEEAIGLVDRPRASKSTKPVEVGGVYYPSQSAACKALKMSESAVIARLKRGWTLEQAYGVDKRIPKQNRPIVVDGKEFDSVKSAAQFFGIRSGTAMGRIKLGWTPEEAFGVKRRIRGDKPHSESEVVDMRERCARGQSFTDIAKYYGIDSSSVSRICRGEKYPYYGGPIASKRTTPRTTLPDDVVREIREAKASGKTNRELARLYNIDHSSISRICCGETYRHVGGPLVKGKGRLSEEEVIAIRNARASGMSYADIAKAFDIHLETARRVCQAKTYSKTGGPTF